MHIKYDPTHRGISHDGYGYKYRVRNRVSLTHHDMSVGLPVVPNLILIFTISCLGMCSSRAEKIS